MLNGTPKSDHDARPNVDDHRDEGGDPPTAEIFIDLQNFNSFLSANCGVNPFRLDIVGFMNEWMRANGMKAGRIRIFTGVPDERIEPQKAEAMRKRLDWLHSTGASIFTHKISYSISRETGEQRGREKGIDVRLACELVEAVAVHGVRRVVVVTQDRDLVQSLDVSRNICLMKREYLHSFSPELRDLSRVNQNENRPGPRCAHWGIPLTGKLDVPLELVDRFCNNNAPRERAQVEGVEANSQACALERDAAPESGQEQKEPSRRKMAMT